MKEKPCKESAVYGAVTNYEGTDAYPAIEEKSAPLTFALADNHAFIDGNKRIAVFVMLMTLHLNSIKITYAQEEPISLGLSVADGKMNYNEILNRIIHKQHSKTALKKSAQSDDKVGRLTEFDKSLQGKAQSLQKREFTQT